MTISSEIRTAGPFSGNGVTTRFPFDFKVFRAEDLLVVSADLDGVETPLELDFDYTVELNPDQNANPGGEIISPAALPVGFTLSATSALDYLQPVDLTNQGGFYPRVINDALDRLTIFTQQLFEGVGRSLKIPLSEGSIRTQLPSKAARANRLLSFNQNGEPTATAFSIDELGAATRNANSAASNANSAASEARQTMGVIRSEFDSFLQASGYQDLGEYAPGIEITAHNQYVTFGGQPYLLKPSIPVPYTTSGEWTGNDFKLIGDDALRQDLANPTNPAKGAALVGFEKGTVASGIVNARLTLLAKSIMSQASAIRSNKPDFRPQTIGELQRRYSQRYSFTSAAEIGDGQPGLVFGSYIDGTGSDRQGGILLGAPFDVAGDYELSVTVAPVHGSSLASLDVRAAVYNSWGNGGARITDVTVSGSGTWTHTVSVSTAGTVIGPRLLAPAGSGLFRITEFSITSAGGKVYSSADVDFDSEMFVSFARSSAGAGVVVGRTLSGLETRTTGVRNGKVPLCVYTAPNGVSDTTVSLFQEHIRGVTPAYPTLPGQIFGQALSYYLNGYALPALIYAPGSYLNTVSLAYLRIVDNNPFDEPTTIYVGCPNGTAVLDTDGTDRRGFYVSPPEGTPRIAVRIANIETTPNIRAHWQSNHVDLMAYRFKVVADSNTSNGIRVDRGDMLVQECYASGVANDGFNHNVRGHSCLIDCIAEDNEDDGFSPHTQCTYEVWGGIYRNNGKANIVPAFGAQGFCVDVESSGATGLSPRAGDYNYGGFVCLSNDSQFRQTTMLLIKCTTNGDAVGMASSGGMSYLMCYDGSNRNSGKYNFVSHGWNSPESGASAEFGGIIDRYSVTTAGETSLVLPGGESKYTIIPAAYMSGLG